MNKLLILLLLIPMISFGEEKYACGVTQLNIKAKEIESISTLTLKDGDSYEDKIIYKITSKRNGQINGINDDDGIVSVIILNTKLNKAVFSQTLDKPSSVYGGKHNLTFEEKCIKIK